MVNSYLNDPHQKKLLKKWAPILESGKRIASESTKVALAQVLENTRNFYKMQGMLNEAGIAHDYVTGTPRTDANGNSNGYMTGARAVPYENPMTGYGDYYLPNVVIPMLRRIMPDLIANDLVGVQPLHGPVGFALAYRPVYGPNGVAGYGTLKDDYQKEIGYAPTDPRYTGANAGKVVGTDVLSADTTQLTKDGKILTQADFWKAYAGGDYADAWYNGQGQNLAEAEYANIWGQNPYNGGFQPGVDPSGRDEFGVGSKDGTYPMVSFGLVKSVVEAKTRKLAAHWSPELAEDMQAMHGIDVEKEMVNTITYEVGAEIDRQIITEMVKAAITGGSVSQWSPLSADGLDQMGRLATLLTQITVEAQQIAIRTRRGNANFVVTTPRVCALLQQMSMNKYTTFKNTDAIPTVPDTGVGALAKIGLINDDQQLLVRDSYAATGANDYVLMGYKGKQAGDSGIIYCPYIPLQLSKVMQPGTFTPSIGARTRYGVMSNPWDARNFYHFMRISDTYSSYDWHSTRHFIAEPSPVVLPESYRYEGSKAFNTTVPTQPED